MKLSATHLLFGLMIAPPIVHAAPDLSGMMTPGLWELTVDMHVDGMPMSLPAQTIRRCVSQVNLAENQGIPKLQTPGNITCKTTSMDRTGDTINWTMACTGQGEIQIDGTMIFDSPEVYQSTVHMTGSMQGRQIQMTQRMQGQRISDCQN